MYVDPHCLDRYRIHHPKADANKLLKACEEGVEIDSRIAMSMVGRTGKETSDRYFVTPDCKGMFVLVRDTLITYLRFGGPQKNFARKHWGDGGEKPPPSPENCFQGMSYEDLQSQHKGCKAEVKRIKGEIAKVTPLAEEARVAAREEDLRPSESSQWLMLDDELQLLRQKLKDTKDLDHKISQAITQRKKERRNRKYEERGESPPPLSDFDETHHHFGTPVRYIRISPNLAVKVGGASQPRHLLIRAEKMGSVFDPQTCDETVHLQDSETNLQVTVLIPHTGPLFADLSPR